MILSGDVGGTHTRLGLFPETGELRAIGQKKYHQSRSYSFRGID